MLSLLALLAAGCGKKEETRTLEPVQLGMTDQLAPIYEEDEMRLFEVKLPVPFPIKAPSQANIEALSASPVPPYPRGIWLTNGDVEVQVTWTLTNLDASPHNVEILVDPWNEFGRYWPGMSVRNVQREERLPNLSGIDLLMQVPGTSSSASRRHGTMTYEDMNELAVDFGTVMNILATVPPPDPTLDANENSVIGLVNHAFNVQNRSYNDVLVQPYIPAAIPGLTGFDLGLRTREPANVAIEIVVELVDTGNELVVPRGESAPTMPEPTEFITLGG